MNGHDNDGQAGGGEDDSKNNNNLRVLGSPNPGQLFGRGLSGPQATEVSRDPPGSWAATNLTVLRLIHFRVPRLGSQRRRPFDKNDF